MPTKAQPARGWTGAALVEDLKPFTARYQAVLCRAAGIPSQDTATGTALCDAVRETLAIHAAQVRLEREAPRASSRRAAVARLILGGHALLTALDELDADTADELEALSVDRADWISRLRALRGRLIALEQTLETRNSRGARSQEMRQFTLAALLKIFNTWHGAESGGDLAAFLRVASKCVALGLPATAKKLDRLIAGLTA